MSSTFSAVFKINPVLFLLLYVLSRCISTVLLGGEPLTDKLAAVLLGGHDLAISVAF